MQLAAIDLKRVIRFVASALKLAPLSLSQDRHRTDEKCQQVARAKTVCCKTPRLSLTLVGWSTWRALVGALGALGREDGTPPPHRDFSGTGPVRMPAQDLESARGIISAHPNPPTSHDRHDLPRAPHEGHCASTESTVLDPCNVLGRGARLFCDRTSG